MLYLVVAVSSSVLTAVLLLTAAYRLRDRLARRLQAARDLAQTQRELENRRVAYDSGREHLVRATAGKPARVTDAFGTKPGTLAKYLRDK